MSSGSPQFDWDPYKARTNAAKHGITFDEAATAFLDPTAMLIPDPDHSTAEEDRWVLLGYSERTRLLVVVHAEIDDQSIRIISARRATQSESVQYHRVWRRMRLAMRDEYDFSNATPNPYADRLAGQPLSTPTTRGEQPPTGTVQIYRDAQGQYRWRLNATTGELLATSAQAYATLDTCRDAVDTLIRAMAYPATVVADAA